MHIHYLEIVTKDVDGVCATYEKLHGVTFGAGDAGLGTPAPRRCRTAACSACARRCTKLRSRWYGPTCWWTTSRPPPARPRSRVPRSRTRRWSFPATANSPSTFRAAATTDSGKFDRAARRSSVELTHEGGEASEQEDQSGSSSLCCCREYGDNPQGSPAALADLHRQRDHGKSVVGKLTLQGDILEGRDIVLEQGDMTLEEL